ncbi:hypothetical protein FA09DRAFT_340845 [Tilletiopsis washingtonensis]|uniref:Uncharacterized protein n=1 Tax=Tilletiopsis washingtonensis TaxID=58919 RepID=A0A316Z296_9BASI|nr:hypothetical protein FA09DRAFT_340845 [Tilletiopsis washingtonensis]PWN95910.1 hypothetical protein FA09DRAFT_340845 [Tilletiopsis washingtonensis]
MSPTSDFFAVVARIQAAVEAHSFHVLTRIDEEAEMELEASVAAAAVVVLAAVDAAGNVKDVPVLDAVDAEEDVALERRLACILRAAGDVESLVDGSIELLSAAEEQQTVAAEGDALDAAVDRRLASILREAGDFESLIHVVLPESTVAEAADASLAALQEGGEESLMEMEMPELGEEETEEAQSGPGDSDAVEHYLAELLRVGDESLGDVKLVASEEDGEEDVAAVAVAAVSVPQARKKAAAVVLAVTDAALERRLATMLRASGQESLLDAQFAFLSEEEELAMEKMAAVVAVDEAVELRLSSVLLAAGDASLFDVELEL